MRLFNKALFEQGDIVQSRNTDNRITGIITKEEIITNIDSLSYQIIYIGNNFYSAWDFEPVNLTERKVYYAEYAKHGVIAKKLANTPSKPKRKQLTLNLKDIKRNAKGNKN